MYSAKKLKDEKFTLVNLKTIIESYEEISAMRMRRVKKSVLQNREFLDGLSNLYSIVETAYADIQGRKVLRSKIANPATVTNGKNLSILLSANTGLYGDIVKKTFDFFIKNAKQDNSDIAVVGRIGRKLIEDGKFGLQYSYFDLADSGSDTQNMKNIVSFALQYKSIVVYHGLFKNILVQEPSKSYVTGQAIEYSKQSLERRPETFFIFEPSADVIARFFEEQLLAALFDQTVNESSLSKFASRMVSLDFASENISHRLSLTDFESRKLKHRKLNSSQLSSLSGISLWKANV